MLTLVWLACMQRKLTKPKLTFCPQNFLSDLCVSHEKSICREGRLTVSLVHWSDIHMERLLQLYSTVVLYCTIPITV